MASFYVPLDDDRFRSTEHTVGPWSAESQHLGPPSALLARAIERSAPSVPSVLARLTVEILGPVPIGDLTVRASVLRPGRSVSLTGATLSAGDRPVATASAWWIATSDTVDIAAGAPEPLPPLDSAQPASVPAGWRSGYINAMEWRPVKGGIGVPGPATLWVRQRMPLVDGEEPSGVQRLMTVADSGNGASNRLDPREWFFKIGRASCRERV